MTGRLDVSLTLRLNNQLSAEAKKAAADLKAVGASAAGLAGKGTGALPGDLAKVSTASARAERDLFRAAGGARALSTSGAAVGRLGNDLNVAAAGATRLDASLHRAAAGRAGLDGLGASAKALGRDLAAAAAAGERLRDGRGRSATGGSAAFRGADGGGGREGSGPMFAALGRNTLAAAGGVYALQRATRATVGEAISFEKAWADVLKKVNDAPNPAAMQELQRSVRQIALDLGIPGQQVAALTAGAAAAGIQFEDLERFTRLTAKAASGWDITPADAAQKLAYIKAATGGTIGEIEILADKINALADNSAAAERDVLDMFLRAGPAAKAAGVDTDTSLAFLTAIRSTGMQEEVAARFWSAFTGKLATAAAGGKGAKDLGAGLEILGLTTKQVADGMKKDAAGTILDIFDRLSKAAEPAKAALKIAGGEWWDEMVRAAQASAEVRKQIDFIRKPANHQGSLQGNIAIDLATTARQLERLKELAGNVGDRLGRWALPGINSGVAKILKEMDGLDARLRLREQTAETGGAKPEPSFADDPIGVAATKAVEATGWVKDKVLDATIGPKPTDDPSRKQTADWRQEMKDAQGFITRSETELGLLKERAKGATGAARDAIAAEIGTLQGRIAEELAQQSGRLTAGGRALGRDMTDVEAGDVWARRSIEKRREIARREALLARPGGPVVFDEERGRHFRRDGLAEDVQRLRDELAAMSKGGVTYPAKPGAGRAGFGLTGAPETAGETGVPRTGPAGPLAFPMSVDMSAVRQQGELMKRAVADIDLSGAGDIMMAGLNTSIRTGGDAAVATARAMAQQISAALSITISPTIAPRVVMPGGAAPASSSGSGGGGAGPVRSAAARPGATFTGPIHVHGVTDLDGIHREAMRHADRAARGAQGDALHDLGTLSA